MKLVVTILLGNDQMQTAENAVDAITNALTNQTDLLEEMQPGQGGSIRDENGNTVGGWDVLADGEHD